MKMINLMKKWKYSVITKANKVTISMIMLLFSPVSFADIIPISQTDQTATNSDFAQTMISIFQKDVIPVVMLGGAIWVLWTGISTMAHGVNEAKEKQNFGPLKNAIIKTVIVVVVGGALLYLLNLVRSFAFS